MTTLPDKKICSRCGSEKGKSEFRLNRYKERIYLHSYCNQCCKEYRRERDRKLGRRPRTKRKTVSIPEVKICSRCHVGKDKDAFRIRTDRRSNPPFVYLNNTCKECDSIMNSERLKIRRSTPEGRIEHNEYCRKLNHKHREKYNANQRARRQTPKYKELMKQYRLLNKDKIHSQEIITKNRYHIKHRDSISDQYAIRMLLNNGQATMDEITMYPELIEIKKLQILNKRLKAEIAKKEKDEQKNDRPA